MVKQAILLPNKAVLHEMPAFENLWRCFRKVQCICLTLEFKTMTFFEKKIELVMSNLTEFYKCDSCFHSCFYKKVSAALELLSPINMQIVNFWLNRLR